jgi:hypothetical protein
MRVKQAEVREQEERRASRGGRAGEGDGSKQMRMLRKERAEDDRWMNASRHYDIQFASKL